MARFRSFVSSGSAAAASVILSLHLGGGCSDGPPMVDAGSLLDAPERPDAFRATDARAIDAPPRPDASGPRCTGSGCEIVEIELGFETTCARRGNGQILCWGRGQSGELGDGASRHAPGCPQSGSAERTDCSDSPVVVALAEPATALYAQGGFAFCAETAGGHFHCWGARGFRVTGDDESDRLAPEPTPYLRGARSFAYAWTHACWIAGAGDAFCIGDNSVGQLGRGDFMVSLDPVQPRVDGVIPAPLSDVLEIATSTTFGGTNCARTADRLYCWGANEVGQIGRPGPHRTCVRGITEFDCSPLPVEIDFPRAHDIVQLALGSDHTCAVLNDGSLFCWGRNRTAELGLGTPDAQDVTPRYEPTEVTSMTNVAEVGLGARHSCARKTDGTVWCWGSNDLGQLGDGVRDHPEPRCMNGTSLVDCSSVPVRVAGVADAIALDVGRQHSCALVRGGEVWCWGNNNHYEIAPGTREPIFMPVRVTGL